MAKRLDESKPVGSRKQLRGGERMKAGLGRAKLSCVVESHRDGSVKVQVRSPSMVSIPEVAKTNPISQRWLSHEPSPERTRCPSNGPKTILEKTNPMVPEISEIRIAGKATISATATTCVEICSVDQFSRLNKGTRLVEKNEQNRTKFISFDPRFHCALGQIEAARSPMSDKTKPSLLGRLTTGTDLGIGERQPGWFEIQELGR